MHHFRQQHIKGGFKNRHDKVQTLLTSLHLLGLLKIHFFF